MLASARFLYNNYYQHSVFRKIFPILISNVMDSNSNHGIKRLFERLRAASKQAETLRNEITSIREEIEVLNESEIFKHLDNFSNINDVNESEEECDNTPIKKRKFEFNQNDEYVVVYTDGACQNNGKSNAKAGLGVWFGDNHPLNISKPVKGKATNNAGEIQACIHAIKVAKENGIKKLKIVTDSQFTINSVTKWMPSWKRNNWQLAGNKGDVKNKADFMELDSLSQSMDIKWEYVAGHKGIRGNEEADRLAREGAKLYKPQL